MTREPNRRVTPNRGERPFHAGYWLGQFVLVLFGVGALVVTPPDTFAQFGTDRAAAAATSDHQKHADLQSDSLRDEAVGIGLLVSGSAETSQRDRAARRGATLAVNWANRNGGFEGREFELLVRTLGATWSSGTEKIVEVAYHPQVWGLVGGLTGKSAHLIEQIVTKRRIVFLTPWASRESLADIRLPWFFRLVPEDPDQVQVLIESLPSQGSDPRLSTVRGAGSDPRLAEEAFVELLSQRGVSSISRHSVEANSDLERVVDRITDRDARHVALFLGRERAVDLVQRMPPSSPPFHFFVPLSQASLPLTCQLDTTEHEATIILPDPVHREAAKRFTRRYERRFNSHPPLPAWYTYDAVRTLIVAIRRAGLDRVSIQKTLANLRLENGLTGPIAFDGDGNRHGVPHESVTERDSSARSAGSLSFWTEILPCRTNTPSQ